VHDYYLIRSTRQEKKRDGVLMKLDGVVMKFDEVFLNSRKRLFSKLAHY
jgi:hypothetical protein